MLNRYHKAVKIEHPHPEESSVSLEKARIKAWAADNGGKF